MLTTILENFHVEKIYTALKKKILYMVIAGVLMALVFAVFGGSYTYSNYRASVSFYVYSNPNNIYDMDVNLSTSEISQANRLINSYVQVLKSSTFLSAVSEELAMEEYTVERLQKNIKTKTLSDAAIFVVYYYDPNPSAALTVINTITELAPTLIPAVVKAGGFRVLDAAVLPTKPDSSLSITRIIVVGFAIGFLIAFAFFFLRAIFDTTIRRVYEVNDIFSIPVLGTVPQIGTKNKEENGYGEIVLDDNSKFIIKEAYNEIRSNVLLSRNMTECPVFVVTSADFAEGKTINAYNIAKTLSTVGKKVLLIDADMRNSKLREIIPNKSSEGLADYLANGNKKPEFVNVCDNLDVIYASEKTKNRAELLSTKKWYDFISEMKAQYDEIVIDMPALGIYSEALSMTQMAACYVIVVKEGFTKFVRTKMIVRKLEELNADIFGIIYNGISVKSKDYTFRKFKEND